MASEKNFLNNHFKWLLALTILLLLILGGSLVFVVENTEQTGNITQTPPHRQQSVTPTAHNTATLTAPSPTATQTLPPTTVTATIPATSIIQATPTESAINPQPLFSEDFTDNSKGWPLGDAAGYVRTLENNTLTLSDTNQKILVESLPGEQMFDNFTLTLTFTLKQGDEHDSTGLFLRGDSNLDHDYRIEIFGNGSYAIGKEELDQDRNPILTYLIGPTYSTALKPVGEQNTLTIIAKGPELVIQINGTFVQTLNDPNYARGQVALFVQNGPTSNGVMTAFSSINIYPAPAQMPNSK